MTVAKAAITQVLMSKLPPLVQSFASQYVAQITSHEVFDGLGHTVEALAAQAGVPVQEYVASGEAMKAVMKILKPESATSAQGTIVMDRCPKCHHIEYGVIK